jgi:deoxyadenosine/deoxycytidine kinase
MYIISVEGNIGSGKSTLIKYMKEHLNEIDNNQVIYLPEPVHLWESIKSEDGKNMIEKFYENQEKYSFSFQMMAYISRLQIFKDAMIANPNSIIITERCLLTDYNIFAKMLYESGKMLKEEYEIYKKWFEYFNEIQIHQFIYIKTDPDISYNRCVKRNRSGENNISLEYLQTCNQMHEVWFQNEKITDVYTINGNVDMTQSQDMYEIEMLKIKIMIQHNLKTQRLNNIMLCMKNILLEDTNQPSSIESHEDSILTDEDREDELSDPKSDDSSYQLSDKCSDMTPSDLSKEKIPDTTYPVQPQKKMFHVEINIGLIDVIAISAIIGIFYMY